MDWVLKGFQLGIIKDILTFVLTVLGYKYFMVSTLLALWFTTTLHCFNISNFVSFAAILHQYVNFNAPCASACALIYCNWFAYFIIYFSNCIEWYFCGTNTVYILLILLALVVTIMTIVDTENTILLQYLRCFHHIITNKAH